MLKLKKLQILGFKSFCDRTELKFHGDGIAAVVGPNGCGKSNISDAISWVLGEQSAKSLRGVRMEDVIFAGTRDRKPTGMAEVSLTLIDPTVYDGADASAAPQVEIHDGFPDDDWDEATHRETIAAATEAAIEEARPGQKLDAEGNPIEGEVADAEATAEGAEQALTEASADDAPDSPAEAAKKAENVILKIRRRKFDKTRFRTGEIVVTRRLFRTGHSEYLLNGKLCRLRDIQDLFMGTGLGPESYAIIEQGRIGQILSSKPHDRRAVIEEAAGVTKYKTRRRLAELRLEAAKVNLNRINDIFDEVTRQMNSLKRQASKAERYAKLRDEMREKLRVVLSSKFTQLSAEALRVDQELEALVQEIRLRGESVTTLETEQHQRTQEGYALDQEQAATRDRVNAIALETERSVGRLATNDERSAELTARSAAAEGELVRVREQFAALSQELAANQAIVQTAVAEVTAGQHEAQMRQQEAAEAALALTDVERQQEARRASIVEMMDTANAVRSHVAQGEEQLASLDREADRLQREISAALGDVEVMGGNRGQLGLRFESESQRVAALQERINGVRSQIESGRADEERSKRHLDTMRAEYATALGKRGSLEALIAEHGYSTESVKRLFQSGAIEKGFVPAGVLADFLEVDNQYESVVEDFLRDELNFVVVKSWDSADQGLQMLRTDVDGRATFLVHPADSQARFSFAVDEAKRPALPRDSVVPLTRCITVLNGFGKSLEVILPKLRSGYIAPDAKVAKDLALENPDAFFLAPNGETFHNVTVTGGKQRAEGPLSMKRELREVAKVLADLESGLRDGETRVKSLGHELSELTSLLNRLEQDLREAERQAMTHGHALQQMETELSRIESRLNSYRHELDRVVAQRAEKESTLAARRGELAGYEQRREQTETALQATQERTGAMKSARDAAAQSAAEVSARLAALEERQRAAAASLQRIETLVFEVGGRIQALEAQIGSAAAEKVQREQENEQIKQRLIGLAAEKAAAELRAQELHVSSDQLRARLAAIDLELKQARHELDQARDRRSEFSAAAAKLQSDLAHMGETCLNELNQSADDLRTDQSIVRIEGEALALEEQNYREMRARLEAMGPVNMMALEEYTETAERHAFLEKERKDLLDSIENTQNAIREIDVTCRQKFEEAFHKINENFQRTFIKLFGGGQAFMRLTDSENEAESGIDIVASPPGKKLQNVLLLSGGEKALTALSLLVGIFQYQPSPFCILDEVDAPLDEANVGRFADLVREMAGQTQFILITHSKRTMEASPVMYGVTMQEPGVSKVVSVRFGEAPQRLSA